MSKTKINVTIGVLTGLLVGFVFGTAFGTQETLTTSGDIARGNVSALSRLRTQDRASIENATQMQADTLRYKMIDEDGQEWNVTISK